MNMHIFPNLFIWLLLIMAVGIEILVASLIWTWLESKKPAPPQNSGTGTVLGERMAEPMKFEWTEPARDLWKERRMRAVKEVREFEPFYEHGQAIHIEECWISPFFELPPPWQLRNHTANRTVREVLEREPTANVEEIVNREPTTDFSFTNYGGTGIP
jgi:hypothetical protein